MKYFRFVIFIALAFAVLDASALLVTHHRWGIKTSANLHQQVHEVAYGDLIALKIPPGVRDNDARYDDALIPAFDNPLQAKEGDLISITGYLHLVAYDKEDGDYHIQISGSAVDGDNCIIVEIPDPENITDADLKSRCAAERRWINDKLCEGNAPSKSGTVITDAPRVTVIGQLFLDLAHLAYNNRGKKGMNSATLWELHPVTGIEFVK